MFVCVYVSLFLFLSFSYTHTCSIREVWPKFIYQRIMKRDWNGLGMPEPVLSFLKQNQNLTDEGHQ